MIRITSVIPGFRRAGMAHSGIKEYPDGHFTPEQIAALKAEPLLVVEELPPAPAQDAAEAAKGEGEAEAPPAQTEENRKKEK